MAKIVNAAVLSVLVLATGCSGDDSESGAPGGDSGGGAKITENHPGDLVITSPARAAFIDKKTGLNITVSGKGATKNLTINGNRVAPAADGSFTTTIPATEGLDLIRAVDGEHSVDVPVLYGSFKAATAYVP